MAHNNIYTDTTNRTHTRAVHTHERDMAEEVREGVVPELHREPKSSGESIFASSIGVCGMSASV